MIGVMPQLDDVLTMAALAGHGRTSRRFRLARHAARGNDRMLWRESSGRQRTRWQLMAAPTFHAGHDPALHSHVLGPVLVDAADRLEALWARSAGSSRAGLLHWLLHEPSGTPAVRRPDQ